MSHFTSGPARQHTHVDKSREQSGELRAQRQRTATAERKIKRTQRTESRESGEQRMAYATDLGFDHCRFHLCPRMTTDQKAAYSRHTHLPIL
jgi:hypothetical protein